VRLTAVVPATDDPPTLDSCRAAILSAAEPPEEVVVVFEPVGDGASAARNAGASRATGDAIVFVDSDVAVHRDAFARIRRALGERPGLTAVIGSYDDAPAANTLVSEFRNLLHHHVHQQAAGPIASFWGGLGAIRRDAFLDAGGFDVRQAWLEDVELGMRLAEAGAAIELDPRLLGKHLKRWTLREMIRTDVLRRGAPWVELLMRRRRAPAELNLSWRHRVASTSWLAATAALAARRPRAAGASLAVAAATNHSFYALLARRLGVRRALGGFLLHGAHYLSAAASVPVGVLAHLRRGRAPARHVALH
jgi:GT2 family glycosyltransferase